MIPNGQQPLSRELEAANVEADSRLKPLCMY